MQKANQHSLLPAHGRTTVCSKPLPRRARAPATTRHCASSDTLHWRVPCHQLPPPEGSMQKFTRLVQPADLPLSPPVRRKNTLLAVVCGLVSSSRCCPTQLPRALQTDQPKLSERNVKQLHSRCLPEDLSMRTGRVCRVLGSPSTASLLQRKTSGPPVTEIGKSPPFSISLDTGTSACVEPSSS